MKKIIFILTLALASQLMGCAKHDFAASQIYMTAEEINMISSAKVSPLDDATGVYKTGIFNISSLEFKSVSGFWFKEREGCMTYFVSQIKENEVFQYYPTTNLANLTIKDDASFNKKGEKVRISQYICEETMVVDIVDSNGNITTSEVSLEEVRQNAELKISERI